MLVGFVLGQGTRVAESRGRRALAVAVGSACLALAVAGLISGLSAESAAALLSVIVGYVSAALVQFAERRSIRPR